MEVVDAVDEASKRAVRLVKGVNFRLEISPSVIRGLILGNEGGGSHPPVRDPPTPLAHERAL